MNKLIFTEDRVFMTVVGPSGSGKTQLIYQMLAGNTFYPKFDKIYFFYQEMQHLYSKMRSELNIQFVPCIDFEMIEKLTDCLLIFDDSCEQIYDDKRFVKIATSGRHKNVHVIHVKHNLFHQSKHSKTIDLNNTQVILFKSPRDVNQITYLGNQLNNAKFLKDCYTKATNVESFGHLLVDFDPKTSDCLRYCSNIAGPGPSIFYLPSSKAVVTPITNERERVGYAEALRYAGASSAKSISGKVQMQFP
jgi:adenylate kinase family enzyme